MDLLYQHAEFGVVGRATRERKSLMFFVCFFCPETNYDLQTLLYPMIPKSLDTGMCVVVHPCSKFGVHR